MGRGSYFAVLKWLKPPSSQCVMISALREYLLMSRELRKGRDFELSSKCKLEARESPKCVEWQMLSGDFLKYCQVMFSINFIYLTIAIVYL